jgi:hypothetical protein
MNIEAYSLACAAVRPARLFADLSLGMIWTPARLTIFNLGWGRRLWAEPLLTSRIAGWPVLAQAVWLFLGIEAQAPALAQ